MNSTSKKYLERLLRKSITHPLSCEDIKKLRLALSRAEAYRDFEIAHYWTRNTYFWAMQVAFLATFGLIAQGIISISSDGPPTLFVFLKSPTKATGSTDFLKFAAMLTGAAVAALGAIVSYIWYLMTKGAKYWQDNWERHIDALEDYVYGPLYKTYFALPERIDWQGRLDIISVTKANELVAIVVSFFWLFLFIESAWVIWESESFGLPQPRYLSFSCSLFIFLTIFVTSIVKFLRCRLRSGLRPKSTESDMKIDSHHLLSREFLEGNGGE